MRHKEVRRTLSIDCSCQHHMGLMPILSFGKRISATAMQVPKVYWSSSSKIVLKFWFQIVYASQLSNGLLIFELDCWTKVAYKYVILKFYEFNFVNYMEYCFCYGTIITNHNHIEKFYSEWPTIAP